MGVELLLCCGPRARAGRRGQVSNPPPGELSERNLGGLVRGEAGGLDGDQEASKPLELFMTLMTASSVR